MVQIDTLLTFGLLTLFFFVVIFGRYVLFSLGFWWLFRVSMQEQFAHRAVQLRPRRDGQDWREIRWSMLTSLIFALIGVGGIWAYQHGLTQIYADPESHSWIWYPFSILLVLFIQETYYYWLHRWMHWPGVYKWVHKIHHDSITTSPWTAFSFHPTESILQALILPIVVFILPLHLSAIGVILLLMTISSAINHLNTEIYPRDFDQHWFGRWFIGATHHSLHHAQFRYNYGLYFTFWDKWMRTESPDFHSLFKRKTEKGNG